MHTIMWCVLTAAQLPQDHACGSHVEWADIRGQLDRKGRVQQLAHATKQGKRSSMQLLAAWHELQGAGSHRSSTRRSSQWRLAPSAPAAAVAHSEVD